MTGGLVPLSNYGDATSWDLVNTGKTTARTPNRYHRLIVTSVVDGEAEFYVAGPHNSECRRWTRCDECKYNPDPQSSTRTERAPYPIIEPDVKTFHDAEHIWVDGRWLVPSTGCAGQDGGCSRLALSSIAHEHGVGTWPVNFVYWGHGEWDVLDMTGEE